MATAILESLTPVVGVKYKQATLHSLTPVVGVKYKQATLHSIVPVIGVKAQPPTPPTADAGPIQYAATGASVTFDGSGTTGSPAPGYAWRFTSLPGASSLTPSQPLPDNGVSDSWIDMAACEMLWHLDDTSASLVVDDSGNGRDGTVTSTTHSATGVFSGSTAYDFNGSSSRIDTNLFNYDSSLVKTIMLWAKSDISTPSNRMLFSGQHTGSNRFYLGFPSTGVLGIAVSLADHWAIAPFGPAADTNWHHYAIVIGASDTKVYVDGVLEITKSGVPSPEALPMRVGGYSYGGFVWDGQIDEVCIMSRELTQKEIEVVVNQQDGTWHVFGSQQMPVFNPDVAGTYTVELIAFNSGGSDTDTTSAIVTDQIQSQVGIVEALVSATQETGVSFGIVEALVAPIVDMVASQVGVTEALVSEQHKENAQMGVAEALVSAQHVEAAQLGVAEALVSVQHEIGAQVGVAEALVSLPQWIGSSFGFVEALVSPAPIVPKSRRVAHLIQSLDLLPSTMNLRGDGQLIRFPTKDDIVWETFREKDKQTQIGGFKEVHDSWPARATLPLTNGKAITDSDFDITTNGTRHVYSAKLSASGVRSWVKLELHDDRPEGSDIRYRVKSGGVEYFLSGTAWTPATHPTDHWSTKRDVQDNFERLSAIGRDLQIVAWLKSEDGASPSFYGFSVAYGVRDLGDEDDAIVRTLRSHLLNEVRSTGVVRLITSDGVGSGAIPFAKEFDYDITAVKAVFNLTDDPNETTELSGTFTDGVEGTPGTPATWTPDTAIADGKELLIEFEYRPWLVISRHRDLVKIARTPTVLIMFGGGAPQLDRGQGNAMVRNLENPAATAVALPSPARARQLLEVSVIGELSADVRRIESELRAFLSGHGHRGLVSPETGRIVDVNEVTAFRTTTGQLAQGLHEARGSWLLSHEVSGARTVSDINLIQTGGVLLSQNGE